MVVYTTMHVDPLKKILSIADKAMRITDLVSKSVSDSFSMRHTQIRNTLSAFQAFHILESFKNIKLIVQPDQTGKVILTDVKYTLQQRVGQIFRTLYGIVKIFRTLNRLGLVEYGFMAKNAVGKLPIFTLTADTLGITTICFNVWDSIAIGLPKANITIVCAQMKLDKWNRRMDLVRQLKDNNKVVLETFRSRLSGIISAEASQGELWGTKSKARLEMIERHDIDEIVNVLERQGAHKIQKWTIIEQNAHIPKNRLLLKIAGSAGKIASILLSLIILGVLGSGGGLALALTVLSFGIVLDALGLTKIFYEEFAKPAPIPLPLHD